jgi:hypothetical protein
MWKHSGCWDKPRATRTHLTHHGPDPGGATNFLHIIFSAFAHDTYIWMTFCFRTPKGKSRNCPGLDGGSHHLPPYSILCICPQHLHSNDFLSQDSQGGVPKLSQFGLLGLWEFITPSSNLQLGWGLKQTCISAQEFFNGVSHFTFTHWDQVHSRLLVVKSRTANLTPNIFLTITCDVNVQMAHARPFSTFTLQDLFNGIKNTSMWDVLTPAIKLWIFESPRGL